MKKDNMNIDFNFGKMSNKFYLIKQDGTMYSITESKNDFTLYENDKEVDTEGNQYLEDQLNCLIDFRRLYGEMPPKDLYLGDGFTITLQKPGEKCNNGGDYGFYKNFIPTSIKGLYVVSTSTTCDFDTCGTGVEGLVFLTNSEVEKFYSEQETLYKEED